VSALPEYAFCVVPNSSTAGQGAPSSPRNASPTFAVDAGARVAPPSDSPQRWTPFGWFRNSTEPFVELADVLARANEPRPPRRVTLYVERPDSLARRTESATSEPSTITFDQARQAFNRWFSSGTFDDDERYKAELIQLASPHLLLTAALAEFRDKGDAGRLVGAANLLRQLGSSGLEAMRQLGRSRTPLAEYFVGALIDLADDPATADAAAGLVNEWGRHPSRDVRLRLIEASPDLPKALRATIQSALAEDADDEIAQTARDLLAVS
jgi:hypothetical protein